MRSFFFTFDVQKTHMYEEDLYTIINVLCNKFFCTG